MDLPYRYLEKYARLLYPSVQDLNPLSLALCHDSFYTFANIKYEAKNIALACLLITATKQGLPTPLHDTFDWANICKVWKDAKAYEKKQRTTPASLSAEPSASTCAEEGEI